MRGLKLATLSSAIVLAVAACGNDTVPLRGAVQIDGSTAVAPLTRAIARRFVAEHPDVRVAVGASGADKAAGAEILVAHDALVLVIAPQIPVRCLTTRQLRQIWHRNSEVTTSWSQVDDLEPPFDGEMTAWGPGTDTEQFAFFNEAVNGRRDSYRDYNNVLHRLASVIPGVLSTPGNLGYVEYGLYKRHTHEVRAIAVDSGDGCVAPTPATIADGAYRPLSRTLSVHPPARALARPVTQAFLQYYLDHVQEVAPTVGFIAPTDDQLDASRARLQQLINEASSQRQ